MARLSWPSAVCPIAYQDHSRRPSHCTGKPQRSVHMGCLSHHSFQDSAAGIPSAVMEWSLATRVPSYLCLDAHYIQLYLCVVAEQEHTWYSIYCTIISCKGDSEDKSSGLPALKNQLCPRFLCWPLWYIKDIEAGSWLWFAMLRLCLHGTASHWNMELPGTGLIL